MTLIYNNIAMDIDKLIQKFVDCFKSWREEAEHYKLNYADLKPTLLEYEREHHHNGSDVHEQIKQYIKEQSKQSADKQKLLSEV